MIRARTLSASLLLVALLGGCVVVEERSVPATGDGWTDTENETPTTEDKLAEAIEDDETNPKLWFLLGDLCESQSRYQEAALAYARMKDLIEEQHPERTFTAGDYHLGRVFALMKDYPRAVTYLSAVLEKQPEDEGQASLNKHYREAHYLLAVIYYNSKQFDDALEHAQAFKRIGGEDLRGDSLIMSVRHAKNERAIRGS